MQTTDIKQSGATPQRLEVEQAEALLTRIRKIEDWCENRERPILQKASFFSSADPGIAEQETRISYVLRQKEPRLYDTDIAWVDACERVMKRLKPAA